VARYGVAGARYRSGDWSGATEALQKSMDLNCGGAPQDWLFLAMAHWQKGEQGQARRWYDKAVGWMDTNKPKDEELARFRAEAEALIQGGNLDVMMPTGADAFAR